MADEIKNIPDEEMPIDDYDHIALEDEEGNVVDFIVDNVMQDYNGHDYIGMIPFEQVEQEEVDLVIMRVEGDELVAIDDDNELMDVYDAYQKFLESEEYDG